MFQIVQQEKTPPAVKFHPQSTIHKQMCVTHDKHGLKITEAPSLHAMENTI